MAEAPIVGRRRWGIGLLLGAGILINYFDRVNISVAAPQLQQEFGLTPADLGLLFSAFFWSYAILQIPVGIVLDRLGVTTVSRIGAFLWGVASGVVRVRDWLRINLRGAYPARCCGGASLSGQFQGDGLLVPARRACEGDRDLRRRGEVLQCHRRAIGGGRRRDLRLAVGLWPHRDP